MYKDKIIFNIVSAFPNLIKNYVKFSKIGKFLKEKKICFRYKNLFKIDKNIDDTIFGGGKGMLIKPEVVFNAFNSIKQKGILINLTPRGKLLNYKLIKNIILNHKVFTLICSRYEGLDERINKLLNPIEISIGDFVLFDGDTAAIILINLFVRYLLLDNEIIDNDSISHNLLEYDQYTKPRVWKNMEVPSVLLSGNHKKIKIWREKNSIYNSLSRRLDLFFNKDYE